MQNLVDLDCFTMLTVTCKVLFVLLILAHACRRLVHFNVTEHPTAQWAPSPYRAMPFTQHVERDGIVL
jgi:hypothetical protein